jgi:aminoglycoside phosphotransferase (APT) family kinase protein
MDHQADAPPPDRRDRALGPLLDYLSAAAGAPADRWQSWRITRVAGGANNLLYRVTGPAGDLAVKFTIRDARDRAAREYAALNALCQVGKPHLAPAPVLLERQRYAQPVVVQTWLDGIVDGAPPSTDADWRALARHFAAIHTVTPACLATGTATPLRRAVLTMASAADALQTIGEHLDRIPRSEQPKATRDLLDRAQRTPWPEWPAPPVALCRCDPNTTNFLRRHAPDEAWASVDWENSGWGDPAFEVADLTTHPAYLDVPPAHWEWVVETYCALRAGGAEPPTSRSAASDRTFRLRVRTYRRLMLVWWVVRLSRSLYEVLRGLDQRLAPRSTSWYARTETALDRYLVRAHHANALAERQPA